MQELITAIKKHGLKDNEIAQLSTHITKRLKERLLMALPDSLRLVISESIVEFLNENDLRIDKK